MLSLMLYIDPGTGSMLFTILIGIATTGVFITKGVWLKIKQRLLGGKVEKHNEKIDIVIFSDNKQYWEVFKPICDELEKRHANAEYWTMSEDDPALNSNYKNITCKFIGSASIGFAKLNNMNAKICLATTPGLDVLQWKRSKNTDYYIFIPHSIDCAVGYRMFGLDCYDAVLMTGPLQEKYIRELEEKRNLPAKDLKIVGSTLMDSLQNKKESHNKKRKEKSKNSKVVLCAPTWGQSSILNKYGEEFIRSLIDTGYDIVIRPHPQSVQMDKDLMNQLMEKFPNNEHFEWNLDNDNFEVLQKSDIMISDFSSVIYNYFLIFDRPIIYTDTEYNKDPYDAAWFDDLPWNISSLNTIGHKLTTSDFKNIRDIIDECIDNEAFAIGREYTKKVLWDKQGRSAEVVAKFLINKKKEINNNIEYKKRR